MKLSNPLAAAMFALTLGLGVTACDRNEGPAEEIGEEIDDAADDAKDAVRDVKREIKEEAREAKEDLKD